VLDSLEAIGIGIAEALIVVLIARLFHRYIREWLLKRLDSPNLSETARSTIGMSITVAVIIVTITALLALWGVTWSGIITALSLGTIGLLLGVQDMLRSLIGGLFLVPERPFAIGDRIRVRDVTGRVIAIELRTTVLRSDEGHRILAPNSIVFTDTMTNFNRRRQIRTSLILAGITGPVHELRTTIERAVAGVHGVDDPVEVRIRVRGVRSSAPLRDRVSGARPYDPGAPRPAEARISWLGDGEPDVKAEVIARLKQLYPKSSIRASNVSGMEVPDLEDV
jgi:hypothetical protein